MPNKLNELFSNEMFEMKGKLRFRDKESFEKFKDALKTVQVEGREMDIEGVTGICASIVSGGTAYPLMADSDVSQLVVAPYVEDVPIQVNTDCGLKTVTLNCHYRDDKMVLEADLNNVVFMQFIFPLDESNISFSYKTQPASASNAKDLSESYGTALGILLHFVGSDWEEYAGSDQEKLKSTIKLFRSSSAFFQKISRLENVLDTSFDMAQLDYSDELVSDVATLYVLLIEGNTVRLDAKLTATETTSMTLVSGAKIPKLGANLDLTFLSQNTVSICGQSINIFTANLLANAVVKEVRADDEGSTQILYGDNENQPMYIAYTGFITEEAAVQEHKVIMQNKDRYVKAQTVRAQFLHASAEK